MKHITKNHYKILLCMLTAFVVILASCTNQKQSYQIQATEILKDSVLILANENLSKGPVTVTSASCERSLGGIHDFYSEGDYWWPDPKNPDGPYIRKDGMTNPNNFTAHRKALFRFSEIVGNLGSAYVISKDQKYADAIMEHCQAWFIDKDTKMTPHLLYAQAIKGRVTGRGIGIIDAIHFMEVVQALTILEQNNAINQDDLHKIKTWFAEFTAWLTTHPYGLKERAAKNNHGSCWNMQVGLFAKFTDNKETLNACRKNFMDVLLPNQMASDGSFPLETKRTKPYGYSLFNLDAMVMNCMVLSNENHNMWEFSTKDSLSILNGLEFMLPYILDKSQWPFEPDIMYWENWPVAQPAFIFGALYFNRDDFFHVWKNNKHFLEVQEVRRNVPIRNPLIWFPAYK